MHIQCTMVCCLCRESVDNGDLTGTVTLTEKGCRNINSNSQKLDQCTIQAITGQCVHKKCLLHFIVSKKTEVVVVLIRTKELLLLAGPSRVSLFLRNTANYEGRRRGYYVIPVRAKDFQDKIQEACKVTNDEWEETIRKRLEFAQDLHAAGAVYHQGCSVNFRRGKQIPKKSAWERYCAK